MALALETVVKQLEDSGIIAQGKLQDFIPPKAHPKTVEELVRELFKQNHLTKFQAQQVAQGKAKALILGGYTLLDKIGAGGMGQVFKAEHRRMKRLVAIKMLPPAMTKDAAAVARFQREVEAAAKLRHPNIVAADDADEANGVHFLVMEYVEGTDLSVLVKKHGPLPGSKALSYILQAARGLEFAHKKGVVHRDIKPANLLVDSEGTVKILDMGLARIDAKGDAATQAELTGTGAVMGTVDYMAPEQALSTKGVDGRADIYSLGCTLYYLLAGKCTYDGDTLMAKLMAHPSAPIPAISEVQDGVREEVQAIFAKMVAKKAEDRYQSMTEVIADLERAIAGQSAASDLAPPAETTDTGLTKFFQQLPAAATKQAKAATTKQVAAPVDTAAKKNDPRLVLYGSIAGGVLAVIGIPLVLYFALSGGDNPPRRNPTVPEIAIPPPGDYALRFDGVKSFVEIPSLVGKLDGPLTLEAYVTPARIARDESGRVQSVISFSGPRSAGLTQPGAQWDAFVVTSAGQFKHMSPGETAIRDRRTHLAASWNGEQMRIFVDGVLSSQPPRTLAISMGAPAAHFRRLGSQAGWVRTNSLCRSDR